MDTIADKAVPVALFVVGVVLLADPFVGFSKLLPAGCSIFSPDSCCSDSVCSCSGPKPV